MAVQRNKKDSMTIRVITSVDAGGVATLANRNLSNINPTITDNDLYLMGVAIGGLLKHETDSIARTVKYDLAAE